MAGPTGKRIIRSSLGVTVATMSTSGVSFLSQVVIARYFGVSGSLDAYLAAAAVPMTLAGLLTAGVGYVLIPLLMELEAGQGNLRETIDNTFLVACLSAALVVPLGFSLSSYFVRWTAPRFSSQELALAAHLQKYFWVTTGATVLTSLATCLHHFRRSFAVPAWATLLSPVSMISLMILLHARMGISSLALGLATGALLQCAILFAFLTERPSFKLAPLSPTTKRFLFGLIPLALSLLPFTFLPVVDAFWSSRLAEGSLSYLGYSTRIVIGLTGVTIQGLTVVIFPFISQNFAEGDLAAFRGRFVIALKVVFVMMLFLSCLVWILRTPAITALFQQGKFNSVATQGLSRVLAWYLAGMVGMACMNLINRGFYSTLRFKTPAIFGLGFLAVYIGLSGWLSSYFSFVGIGMAYATYWVSLASFATLWLGRQLGGLLNREDIFFMIKMVAVAGISGSISRMVWVELRACTGLLLQLALPGLLGIGLLAGLAWLMMSRGERRFFADLWVRAIH